MLFHQRYNSVGKEVYKVNAFRDVNFELHLHKCYEFVYMLDGSTTFVINDTEYLLQRGEALFIMPFQIHRSQDSKNAVFFIISFPASHANSFSCAYADKIPENPVFSLSPATRDYVLHALFGDNIPHDRLIKPPLPDMLTTKSVLYAICAELTQQTAFLPRSSQNDSLLLECLQYIERNFTADVSLSDMAHALNYNYSYLSRIFHHTFGVNFKALVNQYRCEHAQELIVSSELSIAEIAMNSGFQSIRSFNRVFKELTGFEPTDYRKTKISGEK